jgi:flagellar biosynthesis repressor protein FlbT
MNITLRAGERLYINGAVIRTDRKTTVELLNDVTFLLEAHVMQPNDATTPLRQIYFVVQVMLMDPASARETIDHARKLLDKAKIAFDSPEIKTGLAAISDLIARARYFEAMKALRALYPIEHQEMFPAGAIVTPHAA